MTFLLLANVRNGGITVLAGHYKDLVEMVKLRGPEVIPASLRKLPHVRRPTWRKASEAHTVKITAELRSQGNTSALRQVRSGEPLQAGYWVKFNATNAVGFPFTDDYKVQWRVTNTDRVAAKEEALRGDFYPSDERFWRTELLSYRGVHFVEAFLIRKKDNRLSGQSEPFYVVIE